jgi:tetratricopeptide (TPR) repeat protein
MTRSALAVVVAAGIITLGPLPAAAQSDPAAGGGAAQTEPAQPELSREAQIDQLLETLRTAKDADAAKSAERSIMAIWLQSGSDTVDLLMSWALEAIEQKQYALALDYLDRITILKPDYVEGWNKRATVHFLNDDYSKSLADIGRVLSLEPRHFGALSGLGAMLRSIGEDDRAIAAYKKALEIDPHLDDVKKALEELEKETAGRDT